MTPKEKAQELVDKFKDYFPLMLHKEKINPDAKQCALIVVEEMLNALFQHHEIDFWKQVKEEII